MAEPHVPTGVGVDRSGGPVIDPTANVISLVEANNRRLDELREADNKLADERKHTESALLDATALRFEELRIADDKRLNELRQQESIHVRELLQLQADHIKDLAKAESNRLDAIRAVDVAAVGLASERANTQATVLANQVSASAETQRALVATTAATIATQLQQLTNTFNDRIALLEKSQYEIRGKSGVTDPQFDDFRREMRELVKSQAIGEGRSAGGNATLGTLIAGGAALATILGLVILLSTHWK